MADAGFRFDALQGPGFGSKLQPSVQQSPQTAAVTQTQVKNRENLCPKIVIDLSVGDSQEDGKIAHKLSPPFLVRRMSDTVEADPGLEVGVLRVGNLLPVNLPHNRREAWLLQWEELQVDARLLILLKYEEYKVQQLGLQQGIPFGEQPDIALPEELAARYLAEVQAELKTQGRALCQDWEDRQSPNRPRPSPAGLVVPDMSGSPGRRVSPRGLAKAASSTPVVNPYLAALQQRPLVELKPGQRSRTPKLNSPGSLTVLPAYTQEQIAGLLGSRTAKPRSPAAVPPATLQPGSPAAVPTATLQPGSPAAVPTAILQPGWRSLWMWTQRGRQSSRM